MIYQVHLLEAEQFSFQKRNIKAQSSYAAAINSARLSGFIHEQGLACELAGYHFKKVSDLPSAWISFEQAKQCYVEWGSQMKVDSYHDLCFPHPHSHPSPSRRSLQLKALKSMLPHTKSICCS